MSCLHARMWCIQINLHGMLEAGQLQDSWHMEVSHSSPSNRLVPILECLVGAIDAPYRAVLTRTKPCSSAACKHAEWFCGTCCLIAHIWLQSPLHVLSVLFTSLHLGLSWCHHAHRNASYERMSCSIIPAAMLLLCQKITYCRCSTAGTPAAEASRAAARRLLGPSAAKITKAVSSLMCVGQQLMLV